MIQLLVSPEARERIEAFLAGGRGGQVVLNFPPVTPGEPRIASVEVREHIRGNGGTGGYQALSLAEAARSVLESP